MLVGRVIKAKLEIQNCNFCENGFLQVFEGKKCGFIGKENYSSVEIGLEGASCVGWPGE
jgi:hypothetical protein